MLAGETIYLLILEGTSDEDIETRAFANHEEAVEAWHESLDDAIQYEEVESLDELPVYRRGIVFRTHAGVEGRVVAVEVE